MGVLLWGVLIVIIIPHAYGALFALLLRELHVRHPLPLGGTIGIRPSKVKPENAELAEEQDMLPDSAVFTKPPLTDEADTENSPVESTAPDAAELPPEDALPAETANEELPTAPPEVSVFDDADHHATGWSIGDLLESMTAEASTIIPNDLEGRIEEKALSSDDMPPEWHSHSDEGKQNNVQALAAAMPGTKIDFTQESETTPELAEPIAPMVKELFGENFDFNAFEERTRLEKQSLHSAETDTSEHTTSAATVLDVQEDVPGMVNILPVTFDATPQLADFAEPQTILPIYSDDWVEATNSTDESIEGNVEELFFTEGS